MKKRILFMFNTDYIYYFFKIQTEDIKEASNKILEVVNNLADIGLYSDIMILEERDSNGVVHKNPYLICVYEGE